MATICKVPKRLPVVIFDYMTLAQCTTPHITSIVMPAYELGMKIAEHFLALQADPQHRLCVINLPYVLEDRGSTAAPSSTD